jgi:cation:H+ antiporter
MVWPVISAFTVFLLGAVALILCSDAAVESSIRIARRLHISPLVTGMVLVSLGTDFPEIVNSVVAGAAGHANIGLGDAFGSYLAQFTLVLGLLPILSRPFKVQRKEILVIGICALLGLVFAISMAEKGYFTRVNAIMLVASWPAFMILARSALRNGTPGEQHVPNQSAGRLVWDLGRVVVSFAGVAVGSYAVVQSVLQLASWFHVSEFLVSFFVVAIGTSLPEFVVDLAAVRKGQFELAIGDIIGSCLVDATVAVGVGHIFFPQAVSGKLALATGSYAAAAAIVVVVLLAVREKLDRKAGLVFILLYLASYLLLGL